MPIFFCFFFYLFYRDEKIFKGNKFGFRIMHAGMIIERYHASTNFLRSSPTFYYLLITSYRYIINNLRFLFHVWFLDFFFLPQNTKAPKQKFKKKKQKKNDSFVIFIMKENFCLLSQLSPWQRGILRAKNAKFSFWETETKKILLSARVGDKSRFRVEIFPGNFGHPTAAVERNWKVLSG